MEALRAYVEEQLERARAMEAEHANDKFLGPWKAAYARMKAFEDVLWYMDFMVKAEAAIKEGRI